MATVQANCKHCNQEFSSRFGNKYCNNCPDLPAMFERFTTREKRRFYNQGTIPKRFNPKHVVVKCCICGCDVIKQPSRVYKRTFCESVNCRSLRYNRFSWVKKAVARFKKSLRNADMPQWARIQLRRLQGQANYMQANEWKAKMASIASGMRVRVKRKATKSKSLASSCWFKKARMLRSKAEWALADPWKRWSVNTASNQAKRMRAKNERNRHGLVEHRNTSGIQMQFDWSVAYDARC